MMRYGGLPGKRRGASHPDHLMRDLVICPSRRSQGKRAPRPRHLSDWPRRSVCFAGFRPPDSVDVLVNQPAPTSRVRWLAPAALAVALLSLALNGVLLWTLRDPERLLAPALGRVIERLKAQDGSIKYTVRIPAGTPVHFDVPINQRYDVRVNTTLPINTTFTLPVNTPFGNRNVRVPVRANIPIRTDLPVHLRDTFRLRTQTEAEIVVPLEIPIRDLPLDALQASLQP